MTLKLHAPWCDQTLRSTTFGPGEACSVTKDCDYDARWRELSCECYTRRWTPQAEDHTHDNIWLHNGTHLVCKVCGLDGT